MDTCCAVHEGCWLETVVCASQVSGQCRFVERVWVTPMQAYGFLIFR